MASVAFSAPVPAAAAAAAEEQEDIRGKSPENEENDLEPDLSNMSIIAPPPDLKPIVEKTAAYVARMGTTFEAVILGKNQNTRRFDFLHPDNPYHGYYKAALVGYLKGTEMPIPTPEAEPKEETVKEEVVAPKPEVKAAPPRLSFREQLKIDIARSCSARSIPTSASGTELCVTVAPYDLPAADLEIIRLTARFGACAGPSFIAGLAQREQRNPQFEFLRPSHPLVGMYQRCEAAFSSITARDSERRLELALSLEQPDRERDLLLGRIEYERIQKKLRDEQHAEDEDERVAMAMIDWHDFVVMRCVEFGGDEEELPAPLSTIEDINCVLDAQLKLQALTETNDEEEDMDMDMDTQPAPAVAAPVVEAASAPVESTRPAPAVKMQKCPKCNELVAETQLSEHVRICLLDPKWKEQKEANLQKQRESNLIHGNDISKHLSQFARNRSDIFSANAAAAAAAKAAADKVTWNGHVNTIDATKALAQQPPPTSAATSAGAGSSVGAFAAATSVPQPAHFSASGAAPGTVGHAVALQSQQLAAHASARAATTATAPFPPQPPTAMYAPRPPPTLPPLPPQPQQAHAMPLLPPPPAPKRARLEPQLMPEAEFAAKHTGDLSLGIVLPVSDDNPEWKLDGSTVQLTVTALTKVAELKKMLSTELGGIPSKKQKIQALDGRWLKDKDTFAFYNIASGAQLKLGVKERGRKK